MDEGMITKTILPMEEHEAQSCHIDTMFMADFIHLE